MTVGGSAWSVERARDGEWVAVRTVAYEEGSSTSKVRQRRVLGIPASSTRAEAVAHVRALAARGEL